jgi:DNA-binding NtrC family response regulator
MQTLKILAVEHDPPLLDLYHELLSERGHHVVKTRTGSEALGHLTQDVDVVIVDLRSPKSQGGKLLKALHDSAFQREVPVLIVDGNKAASALVKGPHAMTLHKPFHLDRFVEAVESLASTARRKRSN